MRFLGEVWHPNGECVFSAGPGVGGWVRKEGNGGDWVTGRAGRIMAEDRIFADGTAVYPTGLVCISILHPPGDDPNHYEQASERWSPIQSVEKILISVMSMLAEPNDESPANVEAAKMWRERRGEYERRVREGVRRSLGL